VIVGRFCAGGVDESVVTDQRILNGMRAKHHCQMSLSYAFQLF
jgi:hypothetical protein